MTDALARAPPVSGLTDMGVRSYSASAGRFSTPDSVLGSTTSPVSFNRFLYADASPVNATDPTGYWPTWDQIRQTAANGLLAAADWSSRTQQDAQRFAQEAQADPVRAVTNLVGGFVVTSAKAVVDTVGGVGSIIKTAGKAVGDNAMASFGEALVSGARQANSGIDSFASQTFDTSSGSYGYGRSIGDAVQVAMVVVDGASALKSAVKVAAGVAGLAADGTRAVMQVLKKTEKEAATESRLASKAERAAAPPSTEERVATATAGTQTTETATNPLQDIRNSPRELSAAPTRKELLPGPTRSQLTADAGDGEALAGFRGGRYRDLSTGDGIEIHHMPADSVSPLSRLAGPGIQMTRADHQITASWGSYSAAKAYRATQARLISGGDFAGAQDMDIADVTGKFPGVYDDAIQEMLNSSEGLR